MSGSDAQVQGRTSLYLLSESSVDACKLPVHNSSNSQVSLWNLLPQDVIKSVLRKLSVRDSWTCLGVSSCWAFAVRSAIVFDCVVHVQPRQLRSKLHAASLERVPSARAATIRSFLHSAALCVHQC